MSALVVSRGTVAAAACFTALNALKALSVDDYAYVSMARQVAADPFDPFGFVLFWGQRPQPANQHLLTPLVPYVLAPAVALFEGSIWIWKLWLFPFALVLCVALRELARRFARGIEDQVVLLLVFSPALLPAFNLMLDIPALALNLAAVAIFLSASDRHDLRWAILAGMVAGIGAQAKYTALAALPTILLCSLMRRFWRGGALATLAGALTFASWEFFLVARYGHSMLATTVGGKQSLFVAEPWAAAAGVLGLLGGLAPGVLALSLAAARAGGAALGGLVVANILIPVVLVCAPEEWFQALSARGMTAPRLPPELVLFLPLGLITVAASVRAWLRGTAVCEGPRAGDDGWEGRFLAGWVLIEALAFIGMTPFLAARRLIGLITAMTFLVARAACRSDARRSSVNLATALSVSCGCLVWTIDAAAARDTKTTVDGIAARLPALGPTGGDTVWFAAHWSFQYYAEARGWLPVVGGESVLKPGDWLVRPTRMSRQWVKVPEGTLGQGWDLDDKPMLRLTTVPFFYIGSVPYGRLFGPQVPGTIERVLRETTAGGRAQN